MILNPSLAAWLTSAAARTATGAAMAALAAEVAAMPAFALLRRDLPSAVEVGAEAVLRLARAFVEDDAAAIAFLAAAVAAASADPMCRPPFRVSRNEVQQGMLLFSHPALSVQLAVTSVDALAIERRANGGPPSISFTGQRTLFRFLRGGGAILSLWEAPLVEPGFSAAAAGRCRLSEWRRLADGDILEIDGRRESFLVEQAAGDLVYLIASTSLEASPIATEYDPRTFELITASGTDDAGSRTQMMLALLRAMGRRDAAPLFAELTRVPHFHARWQAMREFLALDCELALPRLREMAASDPHEEVHDAAAETLALFFPDRPASQEKILPCPA